MQEKANRQPAQRPRKHSRPNELCCHHRVELQAQTSLLCNCHSNAQCFRSAYQVIEDLLYARLRADKVNADMAHLRCLDASAAGCKPNLQQQQQMLPQLMRYAVMQGCQARRRNDLT